MSKIFACFPDGSEIIKRATNYDTNKVNMWLGKYSQLSINTFNTKFDPLDQFTILPLHKIPANTPYNIFVKCSGFEGVSPDEMKNVNQQNIAFVFHEIINNTISNSQYKKVINDSKSGLVNWWFDYGWEKVLVKNSEIDSTFDTLWQRLIDSLQCRNHTGNINIMTGAEPCWVFEKIKNDHGINIVHANPFETSNLGIFKKDESERFDIYNQFMSIQCASIEQKKINHTHALIYNRVPRPLRALLLSHLETESLLDKTMYSWGGYPVIYGNNDQSKSVIIKHWMKDVEFLYGQVGEKYKEMIIEWFHKPSISFADEQDQINLAENQADNINYMHPQYCNFQIVTETCYNRLPFLTEKTYKAIAQMMPFLVIAPGFGNIQSLKDRGYRTYDKWIDHSYDKPGNFEDRWQLFTKELNRLYSLTPEEWADMRAEMLPDIIYNVYNLRLRSKLSYGYIFYK